MRSALARKTSAFVRLLLVHGIGSVRGDVLVNEFPRSGGSWIGQVLSQLLDKPFPRNRRPTIRSCIIHGHYFSTFAVPQTVLVWRDGRDVMVSWYNYCLFKNEGENTPLVQQVRRSVSFNDYDNIRENLPEFIEYAFTRQRHPGFTWSDFVSRWFDQQAVHIRYEDMHRDPVGESLRMINELTNQKIPERRASEVIDRFSFSRQSGRRPGQEDRNSAMRKGVVGDWKNHFTSESRAVFADYAGEALVKAGYETDDSWV